MKISQKKNVRTVKNEECDLINRNDKQLKSEIHRQSNNLSKQGQLLISLNKLDWEKAPMVSDPP